MNVNSGDKLSLDDRVAMLNAHQRRIFVCVKSHLLHQQQHEANECQCDKILDSESKILAQIFTTQNSSKAGRVIPHLLKMKRATAITNL